VAYKPQYYPGTTSIGINPRSAATDRLIELTQRVGAEEGAKPKLSEKKIQKLTHLPARNPCQGRP
jgi:methyl coenzyme M reductase gamma subunit